MRTIIIFRSEDGRQYDLVGLTPQGVVPSIALARAEELIEQRRAEEDYDVPSMAEELESMGWEFPNYWVSDVSF